ncbi:hypothetical protein ElyMa_005313800 [Elysia marginata]|uniref:Secreted protein n=1 Tax=Elysia marginata TaxID=1093978 RepID=A0AAV4K0U9_9GAST|nr:hypothetical protein ElyMa_005313800 [Elysia marginata]
MSFSVCVFARTCDAAGGAQVSQSMCERLKGGLRMRRLKHYNKINLVHSCGRVLSRPRYIYHQPTYLHCMQATACVRLPPSLLAAHSQYLHNTCHRRHHSCYCCSRQFGMSFTSPKLLVFAASTARTR